MLPLPPAKPLIVAALFLLPAGWAGAGETPAGRPPPQPFAQAGLPLSLPPAARELRRIPARARAADVEPVVYDVPTPGSPRLRARVASATAAPEKAGGIPPTEPGAASAPIVARVRLPTVIGPVPREAR